MSRPTSPTDSTAIPDVVVESPHGSSRSKSVKARSWLQRKIGRGHNEGLSASQAGGSSKSSATSLAAEEDDELPVLRTAAEMKADTNTNTKGDTKVVEDSNTANMDTDTGKDAVQKVLASRSISVSERSLSDGMGNSKKPLTPRSKSTLNKPSVSQNISASSMLEDTHEEMDDISIGKDGKSGQGFRSGVMDRIRRRKKEVSPMSVDTLGNSTFNNSLTPRPYKNHALQQNVGFGKMSNSLNGPRDASGGNSYLRTGGGTVLSINSMTIQGKSPSLHSRTWSAESNSTGASAAFTNTNAKRSTSMLAHMKESERLDVGMNGANAVEEVSFEGSRNEGDQSSQQVTGRDAGGDGVRTENTGLQESRQFIDWGYRAAIAAFFITLFLAVLKEVGYDIVPKILARNAVADDLATLKSRLDALQLELPSAYEMDESEMQLRQLHAEIIKTRRKQQFLINHEVSPYVSINMILKDGHSFGDGRVFNDTLDLIESLDYPKQRLSFNVLISDLEFYEMAEATWPAMLSELHSVHVTHCDYGWTTGRSDRERHGALVQKKRRSMLAKYRNILYMRTRYNDYRHLNNTVVDHISTNRRRKTSHYVLWLDADVEYIPNTIISDLIGSGKHVITPRCLREGLDYDLNTWAGERIEATRPSQYRHLLFVPYPGTLNKNMRDFAESGEEFVEVDSVGGTALLVRSDVHDQGALFPPFPIVGAHPTTLGGYDGIETEGLCYVAKAAGVKCWGATQVVIHHNYYD